MRLNGIKSYRTPILERLQSSPFKLLTLFVEKITANKRIPNVAKAEKILGFKATTSLDQMLDIVIPWIEDAIAQDLI